MVYNSSDVSVLDVDISNITSINIFILILIGLFLCAITPFVLQKFSQEISRLSIFHVDEGYKKRIRKLYLTYLQIMTLSWIFIVISLFSFVSLDNINILFYTLISSSVLSLTVRIMVTTGLINCSQLENELEMDWKQIRERILSSLFSTTVIIVIIAFLGIFMLSMFMLSNDYVSYSEKGILITLDTAIFGLKLGSLWLVYPLILATIGEGLRFLISKIYPPPEELIIKTNR